MRASHADTSVPETDAQHYSDAGHAPDTASSQHAEQVDDARARIREAQAALVGLGYHLGQGDDPADGITGELETTTREAVAAFQDDNGLEVSGNVDADTHEALLRTLEQAMDMRAHDPLDDDLAYVRGEQGQQSASDATRNLYVGEILDDSDAALLELQDELDNGSAPPELEDL